MKNQRGFTLIEIMVAMVIFVIGFLGLLQLQVVAARSAQSAKRINEATAIAQTVSAYLQTVPYTSSLLTDTDTSNDTLTATTYDLTAIGANLDHCYSYGDASGVLGSSYASCKNSDALPTLANSDLNDPESGTQRYYVGWAVQDANLKGDLSSGTYDSKVIVTRVMWRDPAFAKMRSADITTIRYNPKVLSY